LRHLAASLFCSTGNRRIPCRRPPPRRSGKSCVPIIFLDVSPEFCESSVMVGTSGQNLGAPIGRRSDRETRDTWASIRGVAGRVVARGRGRVGRVPAVVVPAVFVLRARSPPSSDTRVRRS
jgi:hypothetical protein